MALGRLMTAEDIDDATEMLDAMAADSYDALTVAYRRIRDELKRLETEKKRIADRIKARVEAGAELPGVKVTSVESVSCTNLTELCEWLAAMDATPADMLDMCKLDVSAFMKALDRDRKLSPGDMAEMREFFTMTTTERLNVK